MVVHINQQIRRKIWEKIIKKINVISDAKMDLESRGVERNVLL